MELPRMSFLVPTRNNLGLIKIAIQSIRENLDRKDHEILVMDDNSQDGTKEWLKNNADKYNLRYITHEEPERKGLMILVEEGIKNATEELICYIHDDMYLNSKFDSEMFKYLRKGKNIVSGTRIEPPIYSEEPAKHIRDFGFSASDFDAEGFLEEAEKIRKNTFDLKESFFAPHLFYKSDWFGYDMNFKPQSKEDSDFAMMAMEKGYRLINCRTALVYHFSGRGSRKKEGVTKDSDEWKQSNSKNERNYIRKWGHSVRTDEYVKPLKLPISNDISLAMLVSKNDARLMFDKLIREETYFNDIVLVFDKDTETAEKEVDRFIAEESKLSKLFLPEKIRKFHKELNMNFVEARNYLQQQCKNNLVFHSDPDESLGKIELDGIKMIGKKMLDSKMKCVGFPRQNYIDGRPINKLEENPDIQFRLVKKEIEWKGDYGVHETPEPNYHIRKGGEVNKEEINIAKDIVIHHAKSSDRQGKQNNFYDEIVKKHRGPIKKIVYNSVLHTSEGITGHARNEIKQLDNLGYKVMITADYTTKMPEYFKKFYEPIANEEEFIYYINQPPIRDNAPQMSVAGNLHQKNLVSFLAVEGMIPGVWAKVMMHPNIKRILTPSEYSKQCLIESGIDENKIRILHHGIDPILFNPENEQIKFDKFTFLVAGTFHLPLDRKGLDLAVKAFNESFADKKDVQLLIKANKIYCPNTRMDMLIQNMLPNTGNRNILVIDDELDEKECAALYASVNAYIAPIRSGAFEMIGLEAKVSGCICISTCASGESEYITKENDLIIDIEHMNAPSPAVHPYEIAKWKEPSVESLKSQMLECYNNYAKYKERALKQVPEIVEKFSWEKIGKELDKILQEI